MRLCTQTKSKTDDVTWQRIVVQLDLTLQPNSEILLFCKYCDFDGTLKTPSVELLY